jgi:hypothetical protein
MMDGGEGHISPWSLRTPVFRLQPHPRSSVNPHTHNPPLSLPPPTPTHSRQVRVGPPPGGPSPAAAAALRALGLPAGGAEDCARRGQGPPARVLAYLRAAHLDEPSAAAAGGPAAAAERIRAGRPAGPAAERAALRALAGVCGALLAAFPTRARDDARWLRARTAAAAAAKGGRCAGGACSAADAPAAGGEDEDGGGGGQDDGGGQAGGGGMSDSDVATAGAWKEYAVRARLSEKRILAALRRWARARLKEVGSGPG